MTRFVYFAWVRERIGVGSEEIDLPAEIDNGEKLIAFLTARGENYAHALEDAQAIRIAVNQNMVDSHETWDAPAEIALFPPMTGG